MSKAKAAWRNILVLLIGAGLGSGVAFSLPPGHAQSLSGVVPRAVADHRATLIANGLRSARSNHTPLWTNRGMMMWGGERGPGFLSDGRSLGLSNSALLSPTPTITASPTPTATPSVTPSPTSSGTGTSLLMGSVLFQGRGMPPAASWVQQVQVTFFDASSQVAFVATPTTDESGSFAVPGIPPGTYAVRVKHRQSLSQQINQVALIAGAPSTRPFGLLPTGDANNNDLVDIVDFSLLRAVFGQATTCGLSGPATAPCADYDASGFVDIVDFSLLRSSFGRAGPSGGYALFTLYNPSPSCAGDSGDDVVKTLNNNGGGVYTMNGAVHSNGGIYVTAGRAGNYNGPVDFNCSASGGSLTSQHWNGGLTDSNALLPDPINKASSAFTCDVTFTASTIVTGNPAGTYCMTDPSGTLTIKPNSGTTTYATYISWGSITIGQHDFAWHPDPVHGQGFAMAAYGTNASNSGIAVIKNSNGGVEWNGIVYAPTGLVNVVGPGTGVSITGGIVARFITLSGPDFTLNGIVDSPVAGSTPALIE